MVGGICEDQKGFGLWTSIFCCLCRTVSMTIITMFYLQFTNTIILVFHWIFSLLVVLHSGLESVKTQNMYKFHPSHHKKTKKSGKSGNEGIRIYGPIRNFSPNSTQLHQFWSLFSRFLPSEMIVNIKGDDQIVHWFAVGGLKAILRTGPKIHSQLQIEVFLSSDANRPLKCTVKIYSCLWNTKLCCLIFFFRR